ncbi:MAG: hypothetical protein ACAH95_05740 [Fimbriimonas sp.]
MLVAAATLLTVILAPEEQGRVRPYLGSETGGLIIERFIRKFDWETDYTVEASPNLPARNSRCLFGLSSEDRTYTVFVNMETRQVKQVSLLKRTMPRRVRHPRALTSHDKAREYVERLARRVAGSLSIKRTAFIYKPVRSANGSATSGEVQANYEFQVGGYSYIPSRYGFTFSLDPQDASLLKYSGDLLVPSVREPSARLITLAQAVKTAYGKLPSQLPRLRVGLGYHLKRGTDAAVLCWALDRWSLKIQETEIVYVDVQTGSILDKGPMSSITHLRLLPRDEMKP